MLKILMEDRQLMRVKMWRLLAEVWAAGALSVGNYAVLYNVQCNNIIDTSRTISQDIIGGWRCQNNPHPATDGPGP